jgi:type IV pilus biogenesis protein PilP
MIDKTPASSNRQKIIGVIVVLILIFIAWQVIGMFRGSGGETTITPIAEKTGGTASPAMPPKITPKLAEVPPAPLSEQDAALMRAQQQNQTQYVQAVNQLQVLRLQRDIAVTDKDIAAAKLAKVTAEKKIVDLLAPPAPAVPAGVQTPVVTQGLLDQEVRYTVVSVSQIQYQWSAVMGYKGSLFSVHVGDVLPPDGSKVIAISNTGVTLQKNGTRKKVSLVPAI